MDKQTIDFIINLLRHGSVKWDTRKKALKRARKQVTESNNKKKFHWQCAKCKNWFRDQAKMEVDHIVEVGPFGGSWDEFISRLYCDVENLQVLCIDCHKLKTVGYVEKLRKANRKSREDEEIFS